MKKQSIDVFFFFVGFTQKVKMTQWSLKIAKQVMAYQSTFLSQKIKRNFIFWEETNID